MTSKDYIIRQLIRIRILETDPTAQVVLFGSRARGDAASDSDWDVLVLIDRPKTKRTIEDPYRDALFQLELEIGEPISVFVFSEEEWQSKYVQTPLFKSIHQDGIRLT